MNLTAAARYIPDVSNAELLRHEARRVGPAALGLPVAAAAAVLALVVYNARGAYDPLVVGSSIVRMSVAMFALAAGLAAAAVIGRERMLEVQLCMPTPYSLTLSRRLWCVGASVIASCAAVVVVLGARGLWVAPGGLASSALTLLGPAAFPVGVAWWVGIYSRSSAAASGAAIAAWLGVLMVWNFYVPYWPNTVVQLIAGVALAICGTRLARNSERILTGRIA